MASKSIILVVSALNMGGAQRVAAILTDQWVRAGHQVTLITTYTDKPIEDHYKINQHVNIVRLKKIRFISRLKLIDKIYKIISLGFIIHRQQSDVVISFLARVNVLTILACFFLNVNLVISERTWPPFASVKKSYWGVIKRLLRRPDAFVVQTDQSKQWLETNVGGKNVYTIPNPVMLPLPVERHSVIAPEELVGNNNNIILAAGRLHEVKQFDLLIKAFAKIAIDHNDWNLVIVGSGSELRRLQALSIECGVGGRVLFPGSVGNIADWYDRADIFVLSSYTEGFPNVLLEAMAHGLAVASFDCDTGPRDLITHGENGLLIDPKEGYDGIFLALKELISSEQRREKLAKSAKVVSMLYSPKNVAKKWDNIILSQITDDNLRKKKGIEL